MVKMRCRTSSDIALLLLCWFIAGCSGLQVRGIIAGQTLESRVDSEIARYYLADYLAGNPAAPALDSRIDQVYEKINGHIPDHNELKEISSEFSPDFAALFFADEIARKPLNRRFREIFDKSYNYTREAFPKNQLQLPEAAANYDLLFVPTYLYKRFGFTGADLAVPRKALQRAGFRGFFVETADDGPIESNADLIMAAIRAHAQAGRRLIIISVSKSGPEVALALTKLGPSGTSHVAAWINCVGALQGTPLIDDKVLPEFEFFVGKVDEAGVESLSMAQSRKRFQSFNIPEQVLVVNYFGIPVSGSLSFRGRRGFYPMQKYGPNDGVILLADMVYPGGLTVTEVGSDHFLKERPVDIVSVSLTMAVVQWLERREPKRMSSDGAEN
jgi:hypothetical protein